MKFHAVPPVCLLLLLSPLPALAGGIYWSDRQSGNRGIRFCELNGGSPAPVAGLQARSDPRGVAVDRAAGVIYFNDATSVIAADYNFTTRTAGNLRAIGTGGALRDLTLDRKNHRLYFADESAGQIGRIALPGAVDDGADSAFPKPVPSAYYLSVAENAGGWPEGAGKWRLFAGNNNTSLYTAEGPAGSRSVKSLTTPPVSPAIGELRGVQIDPAGGQLYWCEKDNGRIRRARYDGAQSVGDVQDIYTGLNAPHGLWLDVPRGKLYWADSGTNPAGAGKGGINRGDMDGAGMMETLVIQNAGSGQPWDLDVDVTVTSWSEWLALYFRKDAPVSQQTATADPDNDGLTNAQEFFFVSSPVRADALQVTASVWTDPQTQILWPAITFRRRPLVAAAVYTPQFSTGAGGWANGMAPISTETESEGTERVTFRSPLPLSGNARQYMRITASSL